MAENEQRAGELEREVLLLKEELSQREVQPRITDQQLESSTDSGHLYPQLPVADRSGNAGWDATIARTPVEERLVVDLGQGSLDQSGTLLEAEPSVDALLSLSTPSSMCDDAGLQPVLPSTLAQPPPPYSASSSSSSSTKPDSTAAVLQSVVDTITDMDEEEVIEATIHSHTKPFSKPSEQAGQRGSCALNNASKAGYEGNMRSSQSGADQTTAAADGSRSKDHFSFVDNLLTTEGGSPNKKTVTVPTGATITYSPRTTRSHAKGNASSARTSAKEQSKPRNTQTSGLETRSKMGVSAPKPEEHAPKTTTGSERMQIKSDQSSGTREEAKVSQSRDSADIKQEHSDSSGSDSHSRLKLDPAKFDLGSHHRNRAQVASSKKGAKNGTEGKRAECETRENGNTGFVQGVENDVCRSSSPIF